MHRGERLAVEHHREQELQGGGEVLQQPDGRERQAAGAVGKPDERHGGDETGAHEQETHHPTVGHESSAGRLETGEIKHRQGR